ncbi:MAG: lipid A export permease/ATP-binding protein MsbA [Chitinophagaceae bacterium]|nr:MAG: lipid A export permease/ATP-binding protein MsbA [Chitinophagaceae bacterium]
MSARRSGSYYIAKISYSVIHNLRVEVFNHMTALPTRLFDTHNSGHLISVITYNINGVTAAATEALKICIREGATVIGLLALLLYKDWKLTMVFLIIAPMIGLLVTAVGKRLRRLSNNVQTTVGDITQVSGEMINGYRVMRTFGGEVYERSRFKKVSKRNYLQNMKIVMTSAANTPVIQLLVAFAMALLIFIALTFTNMREPSEFVGYMTTIGLILQPMRRLGEVTPMILKGVAAADSVFQLLDEPAENDEGKHEIERAKGAVNFHQVTFSYAGQTSSALNSISLSVSPGEVIALVGRSGSGKSTLVNLLPRFYDVSEGRIELDGVAINDYKLANLRSQIAFVNQHVTLFDGTIADNIAYGCRDKVSFEQIKHAADLAYASEFIEKLPDGFNTQIGEAGGRLSGGQRQRLAIARAILKDAPVLILDEATSALDNESERYIQAAMEHVMKNRTTFVIAHRLSTIEHADRILVMDEGKIVEQGRHSDLLAQEGLYAKLHSNQFRDDNGVVPHA